MGLASSMSESCQQHSFATGPPNKGGYIGDYIGFRVWGLNSLKGGYIGDYILIIT